MERKNEINICGLCCVFVIADYKSHAGAGIMLTWFVAKSLWLLANVKFKTN